VRHNGGGCQERAGISDGRGLFFPPTIFDRSWWPVVLVVVVVVVELAAREPCCALGWRRCIVNIYEARFYNF
jgi:hypothetical protein